MSLNRLITHLGGAGLDPSSALFYPELLAQASTTSVPSQFSPALRLILEQPELLVERLGTNYVFDFFYDQVVLVKHTVDMYHFWLELLITAVTELEKLDSFLTDSIFMDKSYVYQLQSSMNSHNELFKFFLKHTKFDCGRPEFLTYTVIARDEVEKLEVLSQRFDLSTFMGIFATALKYGRYRIIDHLVLLGYSMEDYGNIVDLEYYEANHRYLYYSLGLQVKTAEPAVSGSKQDYVKALRLVLEHSDQPINLATLDIWAANATENSIYNWDSLDFKQVVDLLRGYLDEPIPLDHDFGRYNQAVFGQEWSNRHHLIRYCTHLEEQLELERQRYEHLYQLYQRELGEPIEDLEGGSLSH